MIMADTGYRRQIEQSETISCFKKLVYFCWLMNIAKLMLSNKAFIWSSSLFLISSKFLFWRGVTHNLQGSNLESLDLELESFKVKNLNTVESRGSPDLMICLLKSLNPYHLFFRKTLVWRWTRLLSHPKKGNLNCILMGITLQFFKLPWLMTSFVYFYGENKSPALQCVLWLEWHIFEHQIVFRTFANYCRMKTGCRFRITGCLESTCRPKRYMKSLRGIADAIQQLVSHVN